MAAVSMVLTPASMEAWMAAMASLTSVPPHIHPPMAQAPKMMGGILSWDWPSWRGAAMDMSAPSIDDRRYRSGGQMQRQQKRGQMQRKNSGNFAVAQVVRRCLKKMLYNAASRRE